MPMVLTALTVVGTAAMLWVGGHILLVGSDELGLHVLYETVHHAEEATHDALGALGGLGGWIVNTVASAILGLIVGALVVLVITLTIHRRKPEAAAEPETAAQPQPQPETAARPATETGADSQ
jgi:predicted DNA repair protein MutK